MAVRPIVIYGEPVLHQRAAEVEVIDEEIRGLVADMLETMDVANGVGLAAPQVGVGLRIFTFNFDEHDDDAPHRGVVINPRLTLSKISGAAPDPDEHSEGCLSAPGLDFPLQRADYARVQGLDVDGNEVDFEAHGWFARIMQHEYSHLDGKLYVDMLDPKWTKRWKKAQKKEGFNTPGQTWMPGVDPDPFGH
ncbi:MAG: peptide deformylase [Arthrobacter sp.]|nr:peptide deformylase [Arthrobacter sp.]